HWRDADVFLEALVDGPDAEVDGPGEIGRPEHVLRACLDELDDTANGGRWTRFGWLPKFVGVFVGLCREEPGAHEGGKPGRHGWVLSQALRFLKLASEKLQSPQEGPALPGAEFDRECELDGAAEGPADHGGEVLLERGPVDS